MLNVKKNSIKIALSILVIYIKRFELLLRKKFNNTNIDSTACARALVPLTLDWKNPVVGLKQFMTNTNSEIIAIFKQASEGLLFMSESEYPILVFLWSGIAPVTPEKVVQQTDHSPDTPIKVIAVDDFFRIATKEEDWHSPSEQETVKRFQNLVQVIKANLSNPQVYRLGSKEVDVYILGTTPSSDLAGLSTKIIET